MSESKTDNQFGTGATQTADADHLDFLSMPLVGLLGVARTTHEGGSKYGRFNYMRGIPVYVHLNHAVRHILMYAMGDRTEPHLSHAGWRLMAAAQTATLNPELDIAHMPGPGYTLTPDMIAHLDDEAPKLAEKRKDKSWAGRLSDWTIGRLPEVLTLLGQRGEAAEKAAKSKDWNRKTNGIFRDHAEAIKAPPVVLVNHDVEPGTGTTEHIVFTDSKVEWDTRYLDKHGRPIPQSLWIYLKGKPGVRYEADERVEPRPQPGETWVTFPDGDRLYWQDEEAKRATKLREGESDRLAGQAYVEWDAGL